MRDPWTQSTLGEVLITEGGSIKTGPFGTALKAAEYTSRGVPVISVGEVGDGVLRVHSRTPRVSARTTSRLPEYVLRVGDIVFARKGAVDRTAQVRPSEDGCFLGSDGIRVRFRDPELGRFVSLQLRGTKARAWLRHHAGGSTMPSLNQGIIERIPISLPPSATRRRMSALLAVLDDLIDTNRTLIEACQAQISAIVRAGVEGNATSRVPPLDALQIEFGAPFRGASFTAPGRGMPLLRIRDLKTFSSDTWTTERLPGDVVVQPGDVVVGMDAEFRPTYWLGQPSLLNQRVCRVRMDPPGSLAFAREALVKPLGAIERSKTGTTVIHLNKADLERAIIDVPEANALARISAAAEPLRTAIVELAGENMALARTRDELLPLLMSGRVRPGEVTS